MAGVAEDSRDISAESRPRCCTIPNRSMAISIGGNVEHVQQSHIAHPSSAKSIRDTLKGVYGVRGNDEFYGYAKSADQTK